MNTIRIAPRKDSVLPYTSVRFRKPGHKGETWHVTVSGRGGGPYLKDEPYFDPKIPATFVADVSQVVTGRYRVYLLAEFVKKVRIKRRGEHPKKVYAVLFKKASDYCRKHGFVNVDPRWKK